MTVPFHSTRRLTWMLHGCRWLGTVSILAACSLVAPACNQDMEPIPARDAGVSFTDASGASFDAGAVDAAPMPVDASPFPDTVIVDAGGIDGGYVDDAGPAVLDGAVGI